jgi:hypothetical protein
MYYFSLKKHVVRVITRFLEHSLEVMHMYSLYALGDES